MYERASCDSKCMVQEDWRKIHARVLNSDASFEPVDSRVSCRATLWPLYEKCQRFPGSEFIVEIIEWSMQLVVFSDCLSALQLVSVTLGSKSVVDPPVWELTVLL